MQSGMASTSGSPDRQRESQRARPANPPAASWLSRPMLNNPARNAKRDCQAGERERRRLVQHLAEAVGVAPRALEQQPIHRRRRLPIAQDQQIAADQRDEQRDEGGKSASSRAHATAPESSACSLQRDALTRRFLSSCRSCTRRVILRSLRRQASRPRTCRGTSRRRDPTAPALR